MSFSIKSLAAIATGSCLLAATVYIYSRRKRSIIRMETDTVTTQRNNAVPPNICQSNEIEPDMDQIIMDICKNFTNERKLLMKDEAVVKRKLRQMICGGLRRLQVISDFDRTLTKFSHNGKLNPTCHGILEMDPELPEEAKAMFHEMHKKYHAIEVDAHIPDAEKIPFMIEWWTKSHKIMIDSRLHRDNLARTVHDCDLVLRDRVCEFLLQLDQFAIPILIFSAGVGNVIEELLTHFGICYPNVRIVSNFMNFDQEGLLIGFQGQMIHTFNKSTSSIHDSLYHEEVCRSRPNILLMGDMTGDAHMADGAAAGDEANVLRVGFLNTSVDTLMDKYMSIYDIVLVGDETFDLPRAILSAISRSG